MVAYCRTIQEVVEHSDANIALRHRVEDQEQYVEELFGDLKEKEKSVEKTSSNPDQKPPKTSTNFYILPE